MIQNALSTLVKFFIGAVAIGALLNAFDITAEQVLQDIGFTPRTDTRICDVTVQPDGPVGIRWNRSLLHKWTVWAPTLFPPGLEWLSLVG